MNMTIKGTYPIDKFQQLETPFYYYDLDVLRRTLDTINREAGKYENFVVHYAIKANANPKVLRVIREAGLGADCVSGGEVRASVEAGFPNQKIVFAGVGKTDKEINYSLDHDIFCFNVESVPELEVINELAAAKGKVAHVAFRINPNVGAHTHANITTGLAENKFGITMEDMIPVIEQAQEMKNVKFVGLHFHIGSQIMEMDDFVALCNRVNELQELLMKHHIICEHINVGGGLGIDYHHPNHFPIPNFADFFATTVHNYDFSTYHCKKCNIFKKIFHKCFVIKTTTAKLDYNFFVVKLVKLGEYVLHTFYFFITIKSVFFIVFFK